MSSIRVGQPHNHRIMANDLLPFIFSLSIVANRIRFLALIKWWMVAIEDKVGGDIDEFFAKACDAFKHMSGTLDIDFVRQLFFPLGAVDIGIRRKMQEDIVLQVI